MKSALKLLLTITFIFSIGVGTIKASEGTVELESITSEDYRCFAVSIQMINRNYQISVTCRNLIYPAGDNIFQYVMWAEPIEAEDPVRLGELGLGRASFNTKTPFTSLFVTTEVKNRTKEPEGPTVMLGNVERISFLDEPSPAQIIDIGDDEDEELEITPTSQQVQPTAIQSPVENADRNRLVQGLRRAGIVIGIALITIVGIVFVLTRMRR